MSNKSLIILPHISVINANLISGPLTWGFPPMTAFLGAAHRLMRLRPDLPFKIDGVGVVCHEFTPQASKAPGSFMYSLHLSRLPLNEKGESASFVEDGRAHMTISLVFMADTGEEYIDAEREGTGYAEIMLHTLQGMRLAGGSIIPSCNKEPVWESIPESLEDQQTAFRKLCRSLLPGFVLVNQHDLLCSHLKEMREKNPDATPLDALLDICALHHAPPAEPGESWTSCRRYPGWLVPLPLGYQAISPLYEAGRVKNARDNETPFCFVESVCSLGEWKSPHRLKLPQEMLWRYAEDLDTGEYHTVPYTCNNQL